MSLAVLGVGQAKALGAVMAVNGIWGYGGAGHALPADGLALGQDRIGFEPVVAGGPASGLDGAGLGLAGGHGD